jgi:hypothetical protein
MGEQRYSEADFLIVLAVVNDKPHLECIFGEQTLAALKAGLRIAANVARTGAIEETIAESDAPMFMRRHADLLGGNIRAALTKGVGHG